MPRQNRLGSKFLELTPPAREALRLLTLQIVPFDFFGYQLHSRLRGRDLIMPGTPRLQSLKANIDVAKSRHSVAAGGFGKLRRIERKWLFVPAGRRIADTEGVHTLEKTRRVRPDAKILAEFLGFTAGRFGHQVEDPLLTRSPGARVGFWIVYSERPLEMIVIHAAKRFL